MVDCSDSQYYQRRQFFDLCREAADQVVIRHVSTE